MQQFVKSLYWDPNATTSSSSSSLEKERESDNLLVIPESVADLAISRLKSGKANGNDQLDSFDLKQHWSAIKPKLLLAFGQWANNLAPIPAYLQTARIFVLSKDGS